MRDYVDYKNIAEYNEIYTGIHSNNTGINSNNTGIYTDFYYSKC